MAIEPQQLALRVGQTIRLSVSARDSAGNAVTVRAITWSSDDQAVATVSSSGLLVAVESGTASVRATVERQTVVARIPVTRDPPAVRIRQISAGYMHTCAIADGVGVPDGSAYCWGEGPGGRFGDGGNVRREPTRVAGAPPFTSIAAGLDHTCAIATNDATYCWGANQAGQLGDGTLVPRSSPVRVATALVFRSVAVVASTTCALVDGGAAYCWGTSLGSNSSARTPTALAGGLRVAELIDGGWSFMCGRTLTKQVYCWGQFANRTLPTPTLMSGALLFEQVDAGTGHVCGVVSTGESYCWGSVGPSLLGRSVTPQVTQVPTLLQTAVRFRALVPAGTFTCGVADSGAYCFGNSYLSGFESPDLEPHPVPDEARHRFAKISGGGFHACAIDTAGGGWCWGRNYEGQLGGGETLPYPATPRQVLIR